MPLNSNPLNKYKTVESLQADNSISVAEKIHLLKEWAIDEQRKSVSEEENMLRETGRPNQLSEILKALLELGIEFNPHGQSTNK